LIRSSQLLESQTIPKPVIIEYSVGAQDAIKAVTAAIARLGYALKSVDKENGVIVFETGMSM
jgi:hypothetical protein